MRRVVITGMGVVAANGVGRGPFWRALSEGVSGVSRIESFDATAHPVRIAGEVKNFDPTPFIPDAARKSLKVMGRAAQFGLGAAGMALCDSGYRAGDHDPERLGVVMGTGLIPIDLGEVEPLLREAGDGTGRLDLSRTAGSPESSLAPMWLLKYLPNMIAAHISMAFGAGGANNTITTACVAGTQAVGEGFRMVARGEADAVLAGGADSRIDPLLLLAYSSLGALSRSDRPADEVSRPFDRRRDGFVIGEGAAVLMLEDYEAARRRGATVYAEVLGFGSSFDAYSVTKPDPTGRGGARAIRAALREANIDQRDVDHVNAHGTSTRLNDWMETASVRQVFGDRANDIPLSSIKSMIGHSIGASGALEAAALAMTLKEQVIPPTINLTDPDPKCDLDYTPNAAREQSARVAVSTSFGFGGQNGALVMRAV